jgi:hypothetical protein
MITVIECHPPVAARKPAPDLKVIQAEQQAAWSSGDCAVIGTTLQISGLRPAKCSSGRAGYLPIRSKCAKVLGCSESCNLDSPHIHGPHVPVEEP